MQLPQPPRLQPNKRSSNSLASREIGRINLVKDTALPRDRLGLVLQRLVYERRIARELPRRTVCHVLGADGGVEDVGIRRGDGFEDGGVEAKVLGEHVFGGVRDPVVDVEGCAGGYGVSR